MWKFVFIAPVPRTFSVSFHFGHDGIVQLGQAVCGSPHHLRIAPFDSPFGQYISYPHVLCLPFFTQRPFAPLLGHRFATRCRSGDTHGHYPASPLLRPHPTTAFASATRSSPKFPCRTFGTRRLLCPAALTLPKSSRRGDVGFTNIEALTTRKHLTRLYVGSSLALRLVSLSGKTPAHRSPSARLAVLIVCRFLYDIAPSAISSAELCLAYLCQQSLTLTPPDQACLSLATSSYFNLISDLMNLPATSSPPRQPALAEI